MSIHAQVLNRLDLTLSETKAELGIAMVAGSRKFGFSVDNSDYDIRVITLPDISYFSPAERGVIVGFDSVLTANYSSIFNVIVESDGKKLKHDVFVDDLPGYMRQILAGGFLELQNLLAPLDESSDYDNRWPKLRETLVLNLPGTVWYMCKRCIIRDIGMWEVMAKENRFYQPGKLSKKVTQAAFITDFLMTRNPKPAGTDYLALRLSEHTTDEALAKFNYFREVLSDSVKIPPDKQRESVAKFRKAMALGLNEWYDEEIFPVK